MKESDNPIYGHNTIEFVTVALEFCNFVEAATEDMRLAFIDKATKLLPLLYLKASLLPDLSHVVDDDDDEIEQTVTEESYDALREKLATILGDQDSYLDTFVEDMQYSDTPITAFISEDLADVFQATGDCIALFRQGNEEAMNQAIFHCYMTFQNYWGQKLLNALKALHTIRYSEDWASEENNELEEEKE
jgi:hypothetical protein